MSFERMCHKPNMSPIFVNILVNFEFFTKNLKSSKNVAGKTHSRGDISENFLMAFWSSFPSNFYTWKYWIGLIYRVLRVNTSIAASSGPDKGLWWSHDGVPHLYNFQDITKTITSLEIGVLWKRHSKHLEKDKWRRKNFE